MMLEILVNAESDDLVSILFIIYLLNAYYAKNYCSCNVFAQAV